MGFIPIGAPNMSRPCLFHNDAWSFAEQRCMRCGITDKDLVTLDQAILEASRGH